MLLAIDVGNTQTVIGLYGKDDGVSTGTGAERDLMDHWRIATSAERTSDELALLVQEFLGVPRLQLRRRRVGCCAVFLRAEHHGGRARDDGAFTSASRRSSSSRA